MKDYGDTRGLWLCTRFRQGAFEGETCLLVYDDESFDDLLVSGDIKEVFEQRASTANIFIVAPFLPSSRCRTALAGGASVQRAGAYLAGKFGNVHLIEAEVSRGDQPRVKAIATPMTWVANACNEGSVIFGPSVQLPAELREGWLFDLFDQSDGLVVAPPGVHFRKTSGKHTNRFLRAANTLTSTAACALLALFALEAVDLAQPRRILVDTSPLLSVALALMRLARNHGVWQQDVPARTFGSYGGLGRIGRLSLNDVVLVSASTSGSLAQELIGQGARQQSVVTIYFLMALGDSHRPAGVICDLTAVPDRAFGYQKVQNFGAAHCKLCQDEHLLADLEGDQFLLQKRQHKLVRVTKDSQPKEARDTVEELSRGRLFSAILRPDLERRTLLTIDGDALLACPPVRAEMIRNLRRFCPLPLGLVVRVDVSDSAVCSLASAAGVDTAFGLAKRIDWADLSSSPALHEGSGALVIFGCLSSQTRARSINAMLRGIAARGNVTYLSALTLADSAEQYLDLTTFLQYGENGPDTFTYRAARRLAIPEERGDPTAWESELDLLDGLAAELTAASALSARRDWLSANSTAQDQLFLDARGHALAIQSDFVYLDTKERREYISQADIFAVVLNLLCAARCENRPLSAKRPDASTVSHWTQSVYGQVLLSPSNFLNYNDAVLKAAFLRAARRSELFYSVDERCSADMTEIVLAELAGWLAGSGDALPEMLVALASRRLSLHERHTAQVRARLLGVELPPELQVLARAIK